MDTPQIVGLGMACLDILIRLKDFPTWEHGTRINAMGIEGGGPVATALAAASKLGARTGFIGTYGCDRLGAIKLQTLLEYNIDVSRAIQRQHPENQAMLVSVNAENGERIFSGMGSHSTMLRVEELDRAYITSAAYLHLDGYHNEAAIQAAQWMKSAGKTVMLDGSATKGPISDGMRRLVELSDVLICGSGFGPALTGKQDLWQAGEAILALGPRIVVQTEGRDGSYTVTPEECFHTPAFPVEVVDTTGAGDVFHGAFLVGLLQNWPLRSIVSFCTAVSALKCTRLGGRAGIPTLDEALVFLQSKGITI